MLPLCSYNFQCIASSLVEALGLQPAALLNIELYIEMLQSILFSFKERLFRKPFQIVASVK